MKAGFFIGENIVDEDDVELDPQEDQANCLHEYELDVNNGIDVGVCVKCGSVRELWKRRLIGRRLVEHAY